MLPLCVDWEKEKERTRDMKDPKFRLDSQRINKWFSNHELQAIIVLWPLIYPVRFHGFDSDPNKSNGNPFERNKKKGFLYRMSLLLLLLLLLRYRYSVVVSASHSFHAIQYRTHILSTLHNATAVETMTFVAKSANISFTSNRSGMLAWDLLPLFGGTFIVYVLLVYVGHRHGKIYYIKHSEKTQNLVNDLVIRVIWRCSGNRC